MKLASLRPIVLLTRPRRESRAAATALAQQGIDCIRMPLQSTRRAPRSSTLEADLRWAGGASVQIFVSRAAVVAALAVAPTAVAAASTRIAVGRATAAALQRRGMSAISAPGQAEDSDGVLGLTPLHEVRGTRIAIWAAPGGRDRIADVLSQRGAQVRAIAIYQRLPQRPRMAALRRLRAVRECCVLTATSGALLQSLDQTLQCRGLARLRTRPLIVVSERIATLARTRGFESVHVAKGASPEALIAALGDPHLLS